MIDFFSVGAAEFLGADPTEMLVGGVLAINVEILAFRERASLTGHDCAVFGFGIFD
jgi:hypothetical protein